MISDCCHSLEFARQLNIGSTSPFGVLFAPVDEITLGEIADSTLNFYLEIFENHDLISAVSKFPEKDLIIAERLLCIGLARYVRKYCRGRAAKDRLERLLTATKVQGSLLLSEAVSEKRKELKALIREGISDERISHYADTFLAGKDVSFTAEQIRTFVLNYLSRSQNS